MAATGGKLRAVHVRGAFARKRLALRGDQPWSRDARDYIAAYKKIVATS